MRHTGTLSAVLIAAFLVWMPSAQAAPDAALTLPGVELQQGVTVELHVAVFSTQGVNPASCQGKDVLALNGFAHTAATWEPFARALLASRPGSVCRVLALDLPGHGHSGLPTGLPFSFLTLDHFASALLGALAQLPQHGASVDALIAHSQGGIVVQMAQQRLVSAGSSLRAAHGIQQAVLLAPTPPQGLPWAFVENGTADALLGQFFVPVDPVLGSHFRIPDAVWPFVFFSDLQGQLVYGAPTGAQVAALGYNAPEPLLSALQLVGAAPFGQRPQVDAGVFAAKLGTRLTIVAFEQDGLVRPEEAAAITAHLTGHALGARFEVVRGPGAVHDLYVSDLAALLEATHFVLQ